MRDAELARRARTRSRTLGATAAPAVEPSPRRDRSHSWLVLQRPGTAHSRLHPHRLRALRGRSPAHLPDRVSRSEPFLDPSRYQSGRIMARIRCRGGRGAEAPRGGVMSQETLDLRRSLQLVRRHKIVVGIFAALGLLAGVGLVLHRPPMPSSQALVEVLLSPSAQAAAPAQAGAASINPALGTQIVIATSDPVLASTQRTVDPTMSLQTLQSRIQVTSDASSDFLSIRAEGKTAAQAEDTANAVANGYVAYCRSVGCPQVQGTMVLQRATTAT